MTDDTTLRVLLIADTHLGFDLPLRPRVQRRRRGPDFFANTRRALATARRGEVDLVVHGGDVLYRSKVKPALVQMAFEPLLEVADGGVPVVVVPGNHERSAIPYPLLVAHPRLWVLDRPQTVRLTLAGHRVAVSGFPCARDDIRDRFATLLAETDWQSRTADIRLLCMHQTVEGARVGPVGYTFRRGADILPGRALPPGFAAVLAGHIHRHQVLTTDLEGSPLAAPVIYPGSIERTSSAERDETKGYVTLELRPDDEEEMDNGGRLMAWRFEKLPARPLINLALEVTDLDGEQLRRALTKQLSALDPEAVVSIRVQGTPTPSAAPVLPGPSNHCTLYRCRAARPGGARPGAGSTERHLRGYAGLRHPMSFRQ